jgi:hypothetical protein
VVANRYHVGISRQFKGYEMVTLSSGDLIALTIALTSSIIVIITTAIANYRLTESRDYWLSEARYYMEREQA